MSTAKYDLDLVFCLPGRKFSGDFLKTWTDIILRFERSGIKCTLVQPQYNPNVYFARMACLSGDNRKKANQALFRGEIDYKYIVWIDSDNLVTFDQISRLVHADVDIVAGYYKMTDRIKFATVEKMKDEYYALHGEYKFLDDHAIEEKLKELALRGIEYNLENKKEFLVPVDYTGMGLMVVKKGVFETIGYPWFMPQKFNVPNNPEIVDFMSEDVSFCLLAKEKGFQPYIDLGVRILHEKNQLI